MAALCCSGGLNSLPEIILFFIKAKVKLFCMFCLGNILAMVIGSVVATLSLRPIDSDVSYTRTVGYIFFYFPWMHSVLVCELELELGLLLF